MRSFWIGSLSAVLLLTVCAQAVYPPDASAQFVLRGRISSSRSIREANRLIQVGKWEEAANMYTNYLKRYPGDVKARAGLAVVQAELLKLGAAEKNAQEALRKAPKDPYAHIAMGTVYRNQTLSSNMTYRSQIPQLLQKSLEEFQTAARLDPNNPDAHNRLGEIQRAMGQWENAEQSFRKAASIDPKYSEAWSNIGTTYLRKGDLNEAKVMYKKAITLNSKNYMAHYYMGEAYKYEGNYHEAYQSLNTALYLNPESPQSAALYTRMGEVLELQGNSAGAIAKYREAIRSRHEYVEAYQRLSDLFEFQGDGEFAIAELKSALNANPGYEPFMTQLGRLSLGVDKPDQAIQYYQEAIKQNPKSSEALEGLAQAYSMKAQRQAASGVISGEDSYVDAEVAIDNALRSNPNDMRLHLAKLRIAKLSGKPDSSRTEMETIAQMQATTPMEQMVKAEALYSLGKYPESDNLYRNTIQQLQGDERSLLALGESLKVQGNLPMAAEVYKSIKARDPQNLKAERGLQRIQTVESEAKKSANLALSINSRFSSKKARSAKDFFIESAMIYPRQSDVRMELAKLYTRDKEYDKAIWEYEAYLGLNPNLPDNERQSIERKIASLREKWNQQQGRG